jgi:hypothetical protein
MVINSPISTKQTLTFTELTEHKKKTTTCDVGNSGPGLELVQKCSGVSGYGIPIIPS